MRVRNSAVSTAAGLVLVLQVMLGGPAVADDDPVLVSDSDKVTLTDKEGGGATADVTLENQGASDVEVSVEAGSGAEPNCEITPPDDATLEAHRQQKLTFTFTEACNPHRQEGTDFTVTAGSSSFDLHAEPPTRPDVDWVVVGGLFAGAGVLSALALLLAWGTWKVPATYPGWRTQANQGGRQKHPRMALPGLDASWKFSESWAANATVVTALFAGVFGAEKVTAALLGDDSTNVLAVALVSAAVSVGMVGVSPMVVQGLRERFQKVRALRVGEEASDDDLATPDLAAGDATPPQTKDMEAGLYVTPRALILAAFFTMTGTIGQLAALLYAVMQSDFGEDAAIILIGGIAGLLILWYAWRSTEHNLTNGATLPPPAPPTAPPAATTVVVNLPAAAAAAAADGQPDMAAEADQVLALVLPAPAPSPAPEPPRNSAIL